KAPDTDPQAVAQAKAKLAAFKKQIEDEVNQVLVKLPPQTDNLEREKTRRKALEEAFMVICKNESACQSKNEGGDVGWFPRIGRVVEPFAIAAFALKPYQMSDVIETEFGYHVLLAIDHKPGKEVKFEEVRDFVQAVYSQQLRDAIVARM